MPIPKITGKDFIYAESAKKYGMQIFSVPLKEKQHAEILFKDNAMDAFIFENQKLIGAGGFRTPNNLRFSSQVVELFTKLTKLGADMNELVTKYGDAILSNVKKY